MITNPGPEIPTAGPMRRAARHACPAARWPQANGHAQASIEDSLVAAIHAENRAIQERAQAKQKAKLEAARPRDALSVQAQPGQAGWCPAEDADDEEERLLCSRGPLSSRPLLAGAVSLSLPTREQLGLSAAALQRRDATLERFRHLTAEAGVKLAPTDPRTLLSMEPKSEADLKRHGHGRFAPTRSRDAGVTAGAVTAESGGQTDEVEGAEAEVQVPEDSMGVGQAVAEARPAAGFRGGMSADDPLESPGVSGEVSRPGPDAERLRSAGRAEAGPATEPAAWLSEAAEGVRVRLAAMVPEAAGIICQVGLLHKASAGGVWRLPVHARRSPPFRRSFWTKGTLGGPACARQPPWAKRRPAPPPPGTCRPRSTPWDPARRFRVVPYRACALRPPPPPPCSSSRTATRRRPRRASPSVAGAPRASWPCGTWHGRKPLALSLCARGRPPPYAGPTRT